MSDGGEEDLYIVTGYLRGLVDHLRGRGAAIGPVLDAMGIDEEALRDPDRRIPHGRQDAIFQAAERVTGDPAIGLHAGESTHILHFGILGQLAMTFSTGRELLDLHVRYQRLIGNGVRSDYTTEDDAVVLRVQTVRPVITSRQSLEYTLSAQLTLARMLAGPAFRPSLVRLSYPEPPEASEHRRVFGCPVEFDAAGIEIRFPAAIFDVPLVVGDPGSRSALEAEARRRLDSLRVPMNHEDPVIRDLKQRIADGLRSGAPTIEAMAAAEAMSVRTLQRRLEASGIIYRELVDVARREVAERYLADPTLSLTEITFLLGFSDQSSFNRAFKRWFGQTPRDFRARR